MTVVAAICLPEKSGISLFLPERRVCSAPTDAISIGVGERRLSDSQAICRRKKAIHSTRGFMKTHAQWLRIGLYYLVAISVSVFARLYWHTGVPTAASAGAMYLHLVAGMGPTLGVLAVWLVFRRRPTLTFGGTNRTLAVLMIAVLAVVLAIRGVPNPFGLEPHLFGLHLGGWIALYALLEEIGWRGYLQGEFGSYRALARYAVVGLFWYAWHLSWLTNASLAGEAITLVLMIAASIGIGFVADRTRSIIAAAAFHILGNVMGLTTDFRTLIPPHDRMIIASLCLAILILLLRIWRKTPITDSRSRSAAAVSSWVCRRVVTLRYSASSCPLRVSGTSRSGVRPPARMLVVVRAMRRWRGCRRTGPSRRW